MNRAEGKAGFVLALPKGRILRELAPLLAQAGLEPEPDFHDDNSRKLRFATSDPRLEIIRVRSFDVATFVAFGAAQLGVAGNDVLLEFDYPEIYAPVDLGIGRCRLAVAEPAEMVGEDGRLLVDNVIVQIQKFNGRPIGLQLPPHVELTVTSTELGARGDTASGSVTKLATLETGLEIRVPLFIKEGERVRVHTETREFAGRA